MIVRTLPRFPQPITAIVMGAKASPKSCGMVFAFRRVEVEVPGSLKERRHAPLILLTAGRGIAARTREWCSTLGRLVYLPCLDNRHHHQVMRGRFGRSVGTARVPDLADRWGLVQRERGDCISSDGLRLALWRASREHVCGVHALSDHGPGQLCGRRYPKLSTIVLGEVYELQCRMNVD